MILPGERVAACDAAVGPEAPARALTAEQFSTDRPRDDEKEDAGESEELVGSEAQCARQQVFVVRGAQQQP